MPFLKVENQFIIFATHNILTEEENPQAYLLLRCIRSYLEHDMYLGLEQHTEHTLRGGRAWLLQFSSLINVSNCILYIPVTVYI